jgi:hypothetical protein
MPCSSTGCQRRSSCRYETPRPRMAANSPRRRHVWVDYRWRAEAHESFSAASTRHTGEATDRSPTIVVRPKPKPRGKRWHHDEGPASRRLGVFASLRALQLPDKPPGQGRRLIPGQDHRARPQAGLVSHVDHDLLVPPEAGSVSQRGMWLTKSTRVPAASRGRW